MKQITVGNEVLTVHNNNKRSSRKDGGDYSHDLSKYEITVTKSSNNFELFTMSAFDFLYSCFVNGKIIECKNGLFKVDREDLWTLRLNSVDDDRFTSCDEILKLRGRLIELLKRYYKVPVGNFIEFDMVYMKEILKCYYTSYNYLNRAVDNYYHYNLKETFFPKLSSQQYANISIEDLEKSGLAVKEMQETGGDRYGYYTDDKDRVRPLTSRKGTKIVTVYHSTMERAFEFTILSSVFGMRVLFESCEFGEFVESLKSKDLERNAKVDEFLKSHNNGNTKTFMEIVGLIKELDGKVTIKTKRLLERELLKDIDVVNKLRDKLIHLGEDDVIAYLKS